VVVKPLRRHRFKQLTGSGAKVLGTDETENVDGLVEELLHTGVDVMVTEVVPGADGSSWSYQAFVGPTGEPAMELTVRRLRQSPPHFGVASLAVAEPSAEVIELGRRLVRAAGLRGPIEIEFKRDSRDGRMTFIECNHRLNGLLELVHRSGLNVTLLTYRRAAGKPDPPSRSPTWGRGLWHPLLDWWAVRAYRSSGELTYLQVVRSLAGLRLCFTEWAADDPGPALASAGAVLRRVARRQVGR
jgi:predicted ATP-grasp superfamily ATP-dependent carboligase